MVYFHLRAGVMVPSSSPAERGSIAVRMQNAALTKRRNTAGFFKEPASFQQAQGTRDKKQNKSYRGMQSREVPPASPAGGLPKKTTEVGIRASTCALEQDYLFPAFSPLKSCHVRRNIPFIIYGDSHSCLLCSCYHATCQVQALFFIERFFFVQGGEEKKKKNPLSLQD